MRQKNSSVKDRYRMECQRLVMCLGVLKFVERKPMVETSKKCLSFERDSGKFLLLGGSAEKIFLVQHKKLHNLFWVLVTLRPKTNA
jgi:hypothetical protein